MNRRILVIGGGAAGMSAATQARRFDKNAEITVIEKSGFVSYGACGLPYFISGEVKTAEKLIVYTPEYFKNSRNINVFTRTKASRINSSKKTVESVNLKTGEKREIPYDKLVLASGGTPFNLFGNIKNAFKLKFVEDGIAIRNFIEKNNPRKAAIIGAGYIGLEAAEAFRKLGLTVAVFEKAPKILPAADDEISKIVERELSKNGVTVVTGISAEMKNTGEKILVKAGKNENKFDFALIAGGFAPSVSLAKGAGLELGTTGAISVNDRMQTNIPSIFAAGDCVEVRDIVTGTPVFYPLGTTANKTGRVAGTNAAGGTAVFSGIVRTSVSKIFSLCVGRTGLSQHEAAAFSNNAMAVVSTSPSRAHYYPGGGKITTKLIFSAGSGKILGAQMAGADGVAKRLDIWAVAVQKGMTIREIAEADLCYSPPFAPVWDPVLRAANKALLELKR
ncbi:MAG: FAD-dependent oxidoreductase [Elusimicrobia bacterium]|nr:FAD-dependent oxidoreductase [Elusimicrobiota bacterium]